MSEVSKIQGRLEFLDNTVYIQQDGSNNLSFTDSISGTKTLAELFAGVTLWTGLTDTPNSFTGNATKLTQVNSAETALEFINNTLHIQNTDYKIEKLVTGTGYQSSQVTNGFSIKQMAAFAYEATATEFINEVKIEYYPDANND